MGSEMCIRDRLRRIGVKWDKSNFLEDLRTHTNREIAHIGQEICDFSEIQADEVTWGRGSEYGTMSFRSKSDFGLLSLFQITSKAQIKFCVNLLRQKDVPKNILRDYVIKLESNFIRDYDKLNYPADIFEEMNDLFTTHSQVDKLKQCIEGIAYRLRQ